MLIPQVRVIRGLFIACFLLWHVLVIEVHPAILLGWAELGATRRLRFKTLVTELLLQIQEECTALSFTPMEVTHLFGEMLGAPGSSVRVAAGFESLARFYC